MESKIEKKIRNAKYRKENAAKIKLQRSQRRQTEEYRKWKRDYYARNPARFLRDLAKARAKRKHLPFNLELIDIQIPEKCPILGIPILWNSQHSKGAATLDHIIPSQGYVKGNIQVISRQANQIKTDATLEELIAIGEWAREKSKQNFDAN